MCSTQAQHLPEPRRQPVLQRGAASPAVGTRMGLRMMLGDVIRMSTAPRGAVAGCSCPPPSAPLQCDKHSCGLL
jgi:hypothetical protein